MKIIFFCIRASLALLLVMGEVQLMGIEQRRDQPAQHVQQHIQPQQRREQPAPHIQQHIEPQHRVESHPVQHTEHSQHPINSAVHHSQPQRRNIQAMQNVSKVPTMSRADMQRATHSGNASLSSQPHQHQQQTKTAIQHKNVPTISHNPTPFANGDQIKQHFQENKKKITKNSGNIQPKIKEHSQNNKQAVAQVQNHLNRYHSDHKQWFSNQFFDHHHFHQWSQQSGFNWWRAARWGNVAGWMGWGSPIFYDEDGEATELSQNSGDEDFLPEEESNQEITDGGDWMPLGVFAAGKDPNQATYSNMYVQLAVNRQGEIEGTYYNSTIDKTVPLAGSVDKDTQEAVWKISDNPNSPLMSTGMYNLTQNVAPIQVEFPNGIVQSWYLVRVNE